MDYNFEGVIAFFGNTGLVEDNALVEHLQLRGLKEYRFIRLERFFWKIVEETCTEFWLNRVNFDHV